MVRLTVRVDPPIRFLTTFLRFNNIICIIINLSHVRVLITCTKIRSLTHIKISIISVTSVTRIKMPLIVGEVVGGRC